MGILDFLKGILGGPRKKYEDEPAGRPAVKTPRKIELFLEMANTARKEGRLNRYMPHMPDILVVDALKRIMASYLTLVDKKGQDAERLFEEYFYAFNPELNKYADMRTTVGARVAMGMMAEVTDRFSQQLRQRFGADKGLKLAAAQLVKALEKLEWTERSAG